MQKSTPKIQNKNKHHKNHKVDQKKDLFMHPPKWSFDPKFKGKELRETKDGLINILSNTNPEELLMTSLVQKNKAFKLGLMSALEENKKNNLDDSAIETQKVKLNLSQMCPICDKKIQEIMFALHDYDHDKLAHFDCVHKKVLNLNKDKLTANRYLAYLGSGSFGIMENENKHIKLIEKIYPGAPVEELLHGGSETLDQEL